MVHKVIETKGLTINEPVGRVLTTAPENSSIYSAGLFYAYD